MKKVLFLIGFVVAIALFFWLRKRIKEKEGETENPVYNLDPVQRTKTGKRYIALIPAQVQAYAKEVMVKLPSNIVPPDQKIDLVNRLLSLQRESLIAVYNAHFSNYGKKRGYDMIWLLDNFSFLKGNKRAQALRKALSILIPSRPAIERDKPKQAERVRQLYWGMPMVFRRF
jgi:hypothetical protein